MNRMRASIGIFGITRTRGLVSPDYAVFDVSDAFDEHFALQLFKQPLMCTRFRLSSKGLGTGSSGFMRLYTEDFGDIKIPVPPREEQREIVARIRSIESEYAEPIRLLFSQIEKLKEYKATLIDSAVTGKIRITEDMIASERGSDG